MQYAHSRTYTILHDCIPVQHIYAQTCMSLKYCAQLCTRLIYSRTAGRVMQKLAHNRTRDAHSRAQLCTHVIYPHIEAV